MSNETTTYDRVGVMFACDRVGKYRVIRVAVKDGQVIELSCPTDNRAWSRALGAAVHELELLGTEISRGQVDLTVPEQLKLKYE